jgi:multidrug transporter EmrE-like cation transporter
VSSSFSPSPGQAAAPFRFSHRQSLTMVFLCTLFGVAAQFLIKTSTSHAMFTARGLSLAALITNYPLWAGLACYGASTVLLILALRDGELSLLYPVISLTYVWVVALSVLAFHETLTVWKVVGVGLICSGVALLGMERNKR